MIQRKQSLWLLLAALFSIGAIYFDLYHYTNAAGVTTGLRTMENYPLLLIALVMVLLPFIAIFMFKDRKRQRTMSFVSILADLAFISMMLFSVSNINKATPPPVSGSYWIGAILPVVSLVFLILAIAGIRKDDKLVKSMDRLR